MNATATNRGQGKGKVAKSKHTPGPWHAVGYWVETEDDNAPDICTCDPEAMGQLHLKHDRDVILANVRLISAAPDLLEALKALENIGVLEPGLIGSSDEIESAVKKARAAIAYAEGKK